MLFRRYRERKRRDLIAMDLYIQIVGRSRNPAFFTIGGVPDSVDGRFDLVVMHAFLLMHRLGKRGEGQQEQARELSQAVFDLMFSDMDQNLRELGVSDLSVGRKVRHMAEAFFGRVAAYHEAVETEGNTHLMEAICRNLYRENPPSGDAVELMVSYFREQLFHLAGQPLASILSGRVTFLTPSEGL